MPLTTIMLTRPVALSATGLLSAGLAGLAVFLALRHPAGQLRRMGPSTSRFAVIAGPLARLLGGRPDAPSLARRTALSTVCGMAVGLVAARGLDFRLDLVSGASRRRHRCAGAWLAGAALGAASPSAIDHGRAAGSGAPGSVPRRRPARPHGVFCRRAIFRRSGG